MDMKNCDVLMEGENLCGRPALLPGPLVQVVSVSVQSKEAGKKQLTIHGKIYLEYYDSTYGKLVKHEIYSREQDDAQVFGTKGNLTLISPDSSSSPAHACIPMYRSVLHVELYEANRVLAQNYLRFGDGDGSNGNYEHVKQLFIACEPGYSLEVKYINIPFGIYCCIEVGFRKPQVHGKPEFIEVNGNICTRYANTFGNYNSEECVLFEKQRTECERVDIDHANNLPLSTCWVALPAYSSLIVDVELSEFKTGQLIVKDSVELIAQQGLISGGSLVLDNFLIHVSVTWFSPMPLGSRTRDGRFLHEKPFVNVLSSLSRNARERPKEERYMKLEDKSSSSQREMPTEDLDEMEIEGGDESDDDEPPSNLKRRPWALHPHRNKPWPSCAIEIFSVYIGGLERTMNIYGSIEVLCDDERICHLINRTEKDALTLSENVKTTPILDGSRVFEECLPLQMKFNLKDVLSRLAIKGYVDWAPSTLESSLWTDKQLCSFIQGHDGFGAVHYSIFPRAVQANVKVLVSFERNYYGDYPKVYGSLISEYNNFDYSSRYNKEYYRVVLFKKNQDDAMQLNADMTVPLSRSLVVVPSYSSIVVNVDISYGGSGERLSSAEEIEIGEGRRTIETSDSIMHIELDWCEVK